MDQAMTRRLSGICLISDDVKRLGAFYESVLQTEGKGDEQYYYFQVGAITLSIFSTRGMEGMAPGSTQGVGTGAWVVEFQVEDVDAEYARVVLLEAPIVKPLRTEPWGLRSFWFRDPDKNLVDFYAPVAP